MQLRELNEKDINFIASAKENGFIDAWNESVLKSSFLSGRFFGIVAEIEQESVGFLCYTKGLDDTDLEMIYVSKEFRGKKIGEELLNGFIERVAKTTNAIMLEVRKSNSVAISLYKKFGFIQIAERKKYYFDGEDALIFRKEIEK